MRRILIIIAFLTCAVHGLAQGTFEFYATLTGTNELPPNSDATIGTGTFSLTGNSLSFRVNVPADSFTSMNAYIQGPAGPGTNGPIVFDLGGPSFNGGSPQFGIPPSYTFFSPYTAPFGAGPFTLTTDEINQLESGLWYVNVTSFTLPNGQVRGQILSVPEPSTWALFGLAVLLCNCGLNRKKRVWVHADTCSRPAEKRLNQAMAKRP